MSISIAKLVIAVVAAAGAGGAIGYVVAPTHADTNTELRREVAKLQTATTVEADRSEVTRKHVDALRKDKAELEKQLADAKVALGEKVRKASEVNVEIHKKLQALTDKSVGEVTVDSERITMRLVSLELFRLDDKLTTKGKAFLGKLGKVLADVPDKQIWVQGGPEDAAGMQLVIAHFKTAARIDPSRLATLLRAESRGKKGRRFEIVLYPPDTAVVER